MRNNGKVECKMKDYSNDVDIGKINALLNKHKENLYAMYVEYPHKSIWSDQFTDKDFRMALADLFSINKDTPLLLYIHIPFCPKQCYFCTCHSFVTKNYDKIEKYLDILYREIDLLGEYFEKHSITPNFREIHLGGGSPTMIREDDLDQLIEKLQSLTNIKQLNEFATEIDPRDTTKEKLLYYHSKGINRISFGVQDFDLNVQRAINRVQPRRLTENLLTPDLRKYFHGINFDIMWGLPRQTRESFRNTIDTVIELSPDRVSLLLLHYAPEIKKHQNLMKKNELPNAFEKTALFSDAVKTLIENGYIRIGLEHFAKSNDDLAIALNKKMLNWNSLGYTAGRYFDVIGLGSGSSSIITKKYYFQNTYSIDEYENLIRNGKFSIHRGYKLNNDDIIRRDVIHNLRIYFYLDYEMIENKHNIVFNEYFKKELALLEELIEDGILEISNNAIKITETGKYFTFLVCKTFDNTRKEFN